MAVTSTTKIILEMISAERLVLDFKRGLFPNKCATCLKEASDMRYMNAWHFDWVDCNLAVCNTCFDWAESSQDFRTAMNRKLAEMAHEWKFKHVK